MKNSNVFFWSLVVALGGFLFGFDTAVISGAEKAIQQLWHLSAVEHGFTIAVALIGTVFGAIFGGIPSDKFGRRHTLIGIAVLYLVSAVGAAVTANWVLFMVFRFLGGLGVGASSVTAPLYISEVSPAAKRGRMVAMFQFNIVFGILTAYLSNYLLTGLGDNDWRWMLGVQAVPALAFFLLLFRVPESPRWLLGQGRVEEGRAIMHRISPATADAEVTTILTTNAADEAAGGESLFARQYRGPVLLAVLFAVFNQVSGINAIIYYAPRIFEMTGLGKGSALLSSAGIGLVNFLFTLLAMNFIDRFGRRKLMLIGSFGLIATLGLVARSFYSQDFSELNGLLVPVLLFVYIAFFAFSQGAVIWVFISEIFPNTVRAKGQALGSSTHWILAAVIAFAFPYFAEKLGGGHTFLFFCSMMVLQLIFVWRFMPETKGTSLEQLEKTLVIH
ncbi:sugar porter family MFS transporter [Hymenobacter chitinivorans]|uniref:Sugar porter (SP) family MFS transporter n=1 Tax=Hymenobacter chitinivorans DSM 11115 TaxID=1121954 RepID=A0A2M9BSU6_9BACT|nr:sugar porter family MFS transporter [Hymenobacter chitinivorans]PJJ60972.1 sugar porter (SP) family MFS transporter [Hymenobacter chitinivorans DSM 11115]